MRTLDSLGQRYGTIVVYEMHRIRVNFCGGAWAGHREFVHDCTRSIILLGWSREHVAHGGLANKINPRR